MRDFVKERIGAHYCIPLLPTENSYWTDPETLDFTQLPNEFVLKSNSGSGMNLIVKDKSKLDIEQTKALLKQWMNVDYACLGREWQYKDVPRKIICEQFITTATGEPPEDYKIMCSNGTPLYIWVDTGRFTNHRRNLFSCEWEAINAQISFPPQTTSQHPKPKNLSKMLELAALLSKGFPIVRVDFYNIDGKIYFGELTFTPGSGVEITKPFSFSQEMARRAPLNTFEI